MVYKRVPGGEKTEKTGVSWTKDELYQVYKLYEKLGGVGIHEHNPEIQNLAKALNRGVRATEAQLLMFRALSRGKEYSRKNMNSICEDIWEEERPEYVLKMKGKNMIEKSDKENLFTGNSNPFLKDLLRLSQEGKESISGPANWVENPTLFIETEWYNEIDKFANTIIDEEPIAKWLFLIGAPGNGKSALTGRLVNKLISQEFSFFYFDGFMQNGEKKPYDFNNPYVPLPYKLEVKSRKKDFSICSIIQDATVLKKLGRKDILPSDDLLESLIECFEKGRHAVICANRGVIEDVHRKLQNKNSEYSGKESFISLKRIIQKVINQEYFETEIPDKKKIKKELKVSTHSLEHNSFFSENSLFKKLLLKAVNDEKWIVCKTCINQNSCPFFQNKEFVNKEYGSKKVCSILAQFESYSGQTLVFREAIAFISLFLAGNIDDYSKHEMDPCKWVSDMINRNQWFALMNRRIYNSIYNPHRPSGLNAMDFQKVINLDVVKKFYKENNIVQLSYKVGLTRFFANSGIAEEIHPEKNPRIDTKKWDRAEINKFPDSIYSSGLIGEIERMAFEKWEKILEGLTSDSSSYVEDFRLIKRWITSNTFNIMFFYKEITRFSEELEKLTPFFSSKELNPKLSQELEITLTELIKSEEIPITKTCRIGKAKASIEIIPENQQSKKGENPLGLYVSFSENKTSTFVDCRTLCFLLYKAKYKLDSITFPPKLLDRVEISQLTAARNSNYNISKDLSVVVLGRNGEKYSFDRHQGQFL